MTTTRHQATEDYAVEINTMLRTFPRRSTDYGVSVVDAAGNTLAYCLVSSAPSSRNLANIAWTALRAGSAPEKVWN